MAGRSTFARRLKRMNVPSRRLNMPKRMYTVRVDIYEPSRPFPILTHLFNGANPEEAWGYHAAHKRADAFLRQCEDKGIFGENVKCRAVVTEGWR